MWQSLQIAIESFLLLGIDLLIKEYCFKFVLTTTSCFFISFACHAKKTLQKSICHFFDTKNNWDCIFAHLEQVHQQQYRIACKE
jgi:hypothetical protein